MDVTQPLWRKSGRSGNGECVEVAGNLPGAVLVRDSKDQAGPILAFPPSAWSAFIADVPGSSTAG